MTDLKIPNLNKNSDKYIFKKKLSLRRKSKRKLINESYIMLFLSFSIIYINYVIPNKLLIFNNLEINFSKLISNITSVIYYSFEIGKAFFIIVSLITALVLLIGSISRIMKILKRKSKKVTFK